jgi:hypothetical protein
MSTGMPLIGPALVYDLLYGAASGQRFTQDSPLLPEVWLALAHDPDAQVATLSVPRKDLQAHDLARALYDRVQQFRRWQGGSRQPSNVSDIPGVVGAELYFDEIIAVVLPMTRWWATHDFARLVTAYHLGGETAREGLLDPFVRFFMALIAHRPRTATTTREQEERPFARKQWRVAIDDQRRGQSRGKSRFVNESTLRILALLVMIDLARKGEYSRSDSAAEGAPIEDIADFANADVRKSAMTVLELASFALREDERDRESSRSPGRAISEAMIFTLSLNRFAEGSDLDSVRTTKADAAKRLFNISCRNLTFAIIDSGINACHYAFRRASAADRTRIADDWDAESEAWCTPIDRADHTRVTRRFDLSFVYRLRNRDIMLDATARASLAGEIRAVCGSPDSAVVERNLSLMAEDLADGRAADWDLIEELVTVAFDRTAELDHGTHVAGILGGVWPEADENGRVTWHEGMCPDINLYDFKVTGGLAEAREFAIIAAMRLIRHLNQKNDYILIHGANLSLSIPHDVTNYACGRTPVCDEAEKLHKSGVVVVAAAGNEGYNEFQTKKGFKALHTTTSITDPGNTEVIITVGSTHRLEPHNYGVSYFSSRGPTGDGRMKPDLVAPGEKIIGPVGEDEFAVLEGTSMAAPHVSGAAAMLMSRYPEMIGQPDRIKAVLCRAATDVGRERAFQGHGVLDILRALQSV